MEDYGYGGSDDEYCDGVYDDDHDECQEDEDEQKYYCTRPPSCKFIRKESLLAAQKDDLKRTMDLLSLKEHNARTLLMHYRWDVDNVLTSFVEKGKEHLCAKAGISLPDSSSFSSSHVLTDTTCEICYNEFPTDEMTTMECGHIFCDECWTNYFIVQINEGKSRRITCMAYQCYSICDEGKIRNLVIARDPQLSDKFERFLLESYIEDNRRVKWCPSVPSCGNAIRAENDEYCEVECLCGLQFCFSCSSEAHSPCSCLMWELWLRKCKDDSETGDWIIANAKSCPKCSKPVEKNGGCNLVRCICGQPFCWLCGGATGLAHTWTRIANHECGQYKKDLEPKTSNSENDILRYSHYYYRYKSHAQSLKAEEDLIKRLQQKMDILESGEFVAKDNSWITDGFTRLTLSRRFLCYTYPFAFFMFGGVLFKNEMTQEETTIKQRLFEYHQQQLEKNIEGLSMFLEKPFEKYPTEEILEIRMKIIALTSATNNLCEKLYDCIDNELLGPLQQTTHIIAPYRSGGVEKASEILENCSTETGTVTTHI
ncbi:probable E3 ubiquitin-protein ligase ARI2 isoform X1 [Primulina huaijiensis]|uniref:probable E3 ubiquitin-protein ligase ARI2 isoform X1 n=1 Tax=Primulina huaijiensis TaxID=1492673 RepID=UPI003CC783C9